MGLTVNNANTLGLLNILTQTSDAQSDSLRRLSTGHRINSGADNPAGLIAISSLSSELVSVDEAINNGQRAKSVLGVADGALGEVSKLLGQIETLAAASVSSGGLSDAELSANQAQIDNAIDAINRIVQTTSFNGKRLLDGSQSIRITSDSTANTDISDIKLFSRSSTASSQSLEVSVVASAAVASATLANVTASAISDAEFSVSGKLGTATINVSTGDTIDEIAARIVAAAGETGVSAVVVSGTELHLVSREYGEDSFVSASRISGDTDFSNVAQTAGTDAQVTVNGQNAFVDGLRVSFNSNGISGEFYLTDTGNATGSAGTVTINGGGQTFQLGATSNTRATIGIDALFAQNLGNGDVGYLASIKSGGSNDLATSANNALAIAKAAQNQIATSRGRLGGFESFQVDTSLNNLKATKSALTAARGVIDDVDYAAETAELSRQNVLLQSAISLLGVASQQSGQVLSLLR